MRGRSRRAAAALCAAAAHLFLVALGAARLRVLPGTLAGRAVAAYRAYSGADNAYGFFAPAVASEWRPLFDLYDPSERKWTTVGWTETNPSARLLLSTISGHFSLEEVREPLAASWGGAVLAAHPEASIVIVKAQAYLIPKMDEYRAGRRPEWRTLLAYPFTTLDRAGRRG